MKALTRNQYGPPEVLAVREVDEPDIQSDEILVRVHATTVNRTDCGILTANYFAIRFFTGLIKPKHTIPGTDFAGVVVAVGSSVTCYSTGDRVWGFDDSGMQTQAEFVAINHDKPIELIPEGIDFSMAAAAAEGAHYARNFINKVDLKTHHRVLVIGATGAIGSAAVQMLVARGIEVVAVGSTSLKKQILAWGARKVYCYDAEDFTEKERGDFDFIFDAVGKSSFSKCKPLLTKNGIYISSELGPGAENLYLPILTKVRGGKRVIFPFPTDIKKSLSYAGELLAKGKFKPLIDRTFMPEEAHEAYKYADGGMKNGNVILRFHPD